ncbi:MAG: RNB domain-containing ribonuclease [Clostridia bacterium]|nr:RNB domain-containing ribonuclease [Clostridia bacterium]
MEPFGYKSINAQTRSSFPAEVLRQAAAAGNIRVSSYLSNRLDLRGKTLLSFGEITDRHCECAVSVYRNDSGSWKLGLHIADVDEYVCEGSPLDEEAKLRRGAIRNGLGEMEMLPPTIVNDVCDLQVGKDRLAVSVFMDVSASGALEGISFEESVVRVAEKCSYDELDHLGIANDKSSIHALREKYAPYMGILLDMYELAAIFCAKRRERGGLDCTVFRRNFARNSAGNIEFDFAQEPDARAMVRELGYFAAEAIGNYMRERELPCIYIGQETLDKTALDFLGALVGETKKDLPDHERAAEIADLAKGSRYYGFVCTAIRRALPCATFSDEPVFNSIGATDHLVSFIHPTTRYSSLLTLRMIKNGILASGDAKNLNLNRYRKIASNAAENANEAEGVICNAQKSYFIASAEEFVQNNASTVHKGFPFRKRENGDVSVMLVCGLIATVPFKHLEGLDLVIGADYDFELLDFAEEKAVVYVNPCN